MFKEKQLKQLNATFFKGITASIQKDFTGKYLNVMYTNLFWIFFPFVMVPIGEYAIFLLFKKTLSRNAKL
jgi:hypothetical protein